MSMRYAAAVLLILKCTASPTLTLTSVVKPCSVGSPTPLMSQSALETPGFEFSQTIALLPSPHGSSASRFCGAAFCGAAFCGAAVALTPEPGRLPLGPAGEAA